MSQATGSSGVGCAPRRRGLLRAFWYWLPVLVPLLILGQVCLQGLRPALAEGRRLEREEPAVRARHEDAQVRFETMELRVRAWRDPVYQERLRRQRDRDKGE